MGVSMNGALSVLALGGAGDLFTVSHELYTEFIHEAFLLIDAVLNDYQTIIIHLVSNQQQEDVQTWLLWTKI